MLPNALETWRPMIPAERQSSMLRRVSMRAKQQYKLSQGFIQRRSPAWSAPGAARPQPGLTL